MKKFYFEPEMNISTFSAGDVVTTSGNTPVNGVSGNAAQSTIVGLGDASRAEVAFEMLQFN